MGEPEVAAITYVVITTYIAFTHYKVNKGRDITTTYNRNNYDDCFGCIPMFPEQIRDSYMQCFRDFLMPSYCVVTKTTQELATALLMTYSYLHSQNLLNALLCTLHLKLNKLLPLYIK